MSSLKLTQFGFYVSVSFLFKDLASVGIHSIVFGLDVRSDLPVNIHHIYYYV